MIPCECHHIRSVDCVYVCLYNHHSTLSQAKHELRRRKSIEEINQLKVKRSSEIYMSFKESREKICKVAEEDSKELEIEWQEQGKYTYRHKQLLQTQGKYTRHHKQFIQEQGKCTEHHNF